MIDELAFDERLAPENGGSSPWPEPEPSPSMPLPLID
jgi:hypothetical protein